MQWSTFCGVISTSKWHIIIWFGIYPLLCYVLPLLRLLFIFSYPNYGPCTTCWVMLPNWSIIVFDDVLTHTHTYTLSISLDLTYTPTAPCGVDIIIVSPYSSIWYGYGYAASLPRAYTLHLIYMSPTPLIPHRHWTGFFGCYQASLPVGTFGLGKQQ